MTIRPRHSAGSPRAPTIRDVAVRAGVSTGTVSSVITGLRPVAEESRLLVRAAIDELGFKANYMASSLRLGKSRTIGVVVPDLANEFYAGLVRHYEKEAAQIGYEVLVVASGDDANKEASRIGSLIERRVDGLLVVPTEDDFGSVDTFPKNLPPTVLVDRNFGNPRFDAVASDNFGAGKLGCELLLQLGHREIILLTPSLVNANVRERIEGYRTAIRAAIRTGPAVGGPGRPPCPHGARCRRTPPAVRRWRGFARRAASAFRAVVLRAASAGSTWRQCPAPGWGWPAPNALQI